MCVFLNICVCVCVCGHIVQPGLCHYTLIETNSCSLCICVVCGSNIISVCPSSLVLTCFQTGCPHAKFIMHRNLYENCLYKTDRIVEPVFQAKITVKYKKPQGPWRKAAFVSHGKQ